MIDSRLLGPFTATGAVAGATRLAFGRLSLFGLMLAGTYIPVLIALGLVYFLSSVTPFGEAGFQPSPVLVQSLNIGMAILSFSFVIYCYTATIYMLVMDAIGQKFTLRHALWHAFTAFPAVLVAAILTFLAVAAGTVALIVPGIVISLILFVVLPAALVDRRGPFAAMSASAALTQDHRLPVFFANLLQVLVLFCLSMCLLLALGFDLFAGFDPQVAPRQTTLPEQLLLDAVNAAGLFWFLALVAYTYAHLRVLKEGPPSGASGTGGSDVMASPGRRSPPAPGQ